jgi:hypothetical protein
MGKKIFISYKYGDTSVLHLTRNYSWETTRVRDYVDELQDKLSETDHINKGEQDGEDLSNFKDGTIASKLRDKIYDSSVTVVLISPNMKESWNKEEDQWIPWEISYSLKEVKRSDTTSRTNAIIGVVLPDNSGSYDYMITTNNCGYCSCTTLHLLNTFSIIRNNTFNRLTKEYFPCSQNKTIHKWPASYFHIVRWDRFISNIDDCLNEALNIQRQAGDFDIHKDIV